MKTTINFNLFQESFYNYGRSDNFSYGGLKALFDYVTELETQMQTEFELDIVGLCCEYREIFNNEKEYKLYVGKRSEYADSIISYLTSSILIRV